MILLSLGYPNTKIILFPRSIHYKYLDKKRLQASTSRTRVVDDHYLMFDARFGFLRGYSVVTKKHHLHRDRR